MRSVLRYFWIICSLSIFFVGCNQETSDIGNEFLEPRSNMAFIDTLSVKLSTFQFDSVPTSGRNLILCGQIKDKNMGVITANSFFQVGIPSVNYVDSNYYAYDSICLTLLYGNIIIGDTLANYNIKVNQLDERPLFDNQRTEFYSTTNFKDSFEIGNLTIRPRPLLRDTLNIKLSDKLGLDLFRKLNEEKDGNKVRMLDNQDRFLNYFKGISLKSGDNNLVLGFNVSNNQNTPQVSLRVFYHKSNVSKDTISSHSDFRIVNSNMQFNQFKIDKSGTLIKDLLPGKKLLNSEQTGNSAYMISGAGICIKVEFPYIQKLKDISKYYRIMAADLVVEPLIRTYSNSNPFPQKMVLSQTDGNNEIGNVIVNSASSSGEANYGNLGSIDFLNPENNRFTYDITSYIYYLLNKTSSDELGLLFHSPNFYTSLERIIIGNQKNNLNRTYLKVYYIYYEE